ncbi:MULTISPECIES: fibronectin type III domain-containing protein [Flavobacterium]|uniref:fibronectin type III domain-containing protein n=1 Tax=Flavobacterium TaxID=237 RepID=UPI001FCB1354|nr:MULTISPECIES: GEVED domain-containing protein [Flavobacterium]UOK43614.1 M12 family metallo-peptidase [Flavobacterium enshiense]
MKRLICAALLFTVTYGIAQSKDALWKKNTSSNASGRITKSDLPQKNIFDLDVPAMKKMLAKSPKREASNITSNTIISLPNGEGKLENFKVYENSVMAPELAAKYPEIKSYVAVGVDNPKARAYFSNSPLGFKSMTLYPDQSAVFIEPITDDSNTYTIYKKSDKKDSLDKFECSTIDQAIHNIQPTNNTSEFARGADDAKLRTLRLALSCNGEYASYFGGTKALALAGMNNTLTRVNGVFETDFGIKLILIANNDAVIFTNATTDPYSDDKSGWGTSVQSTLTSAIGEANYDMGHLLAGNVGGGDAGCIGCVGVDGTKGRGYSSTVNNTPEGDAYDISYVAHEMGHQLGANHTFTHVTENGTGVQMEPGSGSTIMGYVGITTKDVQKQADAYFHTASISQVTYNIKNKTCPVLISTGNAVPTVNAGLDYTIPKGTPFMLTGSASDANTDDVLTYCWEQMNAGNATTSTPTSTATTGPLFRSYLPNSNPTRYFPKMSTILAGLTTTAGTDIPVEVLPSVARTLKFTLTVRDNRTGGAANNGDDMFVTVDGASGPFTVDTQNAAVSYAAGTSQTINWTVAGTNANGVNCANVDILLSTDGGQTFPTVLLAGTPNDGSQSVVIPNKPGTTNRIMVKGSNHIFFDVNNANFTITGSGSADTAAPTASTLSASGTTASSTNLSWTAATDNVGVTGYNVYQNGVLKTTTTATSLAVSGLTASTAYNFYVTTKDAAGNVSTASNTVNVTTSALADTVVPSASTLSASGTTASSTNLTWTAATDNVGVTGYNVYQNGVLKTTVTGTTLAVSGLTASTAYNFYVTTKDAAGNVSTASNTVNVTTSAVADTAVPTVSTLSASGTTASSTNLSWTAATDNVGVTGYNVYQNGVLKTTVTGTTLGISGLASSTAYNFYVKAKDVAGNVSTASNTVNVTTSALADTAVPTVSTLSASGTTASSTNLTWTTATDNVGVTGYNVYQNGVLKTTVTGTTLAVSGLASSTAYNFYVKAKDVAGNVSSASNTVNVTTPALADTSVPSASTLSASGTTASSTNLAWTAASDNVGVTGYNVYQNGVLKTTVTGTTLAVSGLSASTAYNFYVKAKDAAGNLSSASNTVNVTTLGAGITYCNSNGSTSREYINRVQLGSINNLSGNNNGYGNYTTQSTSLSTGSTASITITPGWNGMSANEAYCVWIDFNKDGNFGSNELVFSKSKTKSTSVSGSFIIPSTALTGATRMRISMKYNAFPTACEVFTNGEVEDYTVNITSNATVKIDNETSDDSAAVVKEEVSTLSFKLYPNPVKDETLHFSGIENNAPYRIFTLTGQQIANGNINNNAINVGTLPLGMYIIEITDGKSVGTKRFIKE